LLAADAANAETRRDVAQTLLKLGTLRSRADATQACTFFRESAQVWLELERQQAVDAADRASAEQARRAAARCGTAR
jgi:hypothetical protein